MTKRIYKNDVTSSKGRRIYADVECEGNLTVYGWLQIVGRLVVRGNIVVEGSLDVSNGLVVEGDFRTTGTGFLKGSSQFRGSFLSTNTNVTFFDGRTIFNGDTDIHCHVNFKDYVSFPEEDSHFIARRHVAWGSVLKPNLPKKTYINYVQMLHGEERHFAKRFGLMYEQGDSYEDMVPKVNTDKLLKETHWSDCERWILESLRDKGAPFPDWVPMVDEGDIRNEI